MSRRFSQGFTIVETMLFLAITGALIVGVLVGTGAAIDNQRYRDAVESLKSLVQAQYSELGSVKNDRSNNLACGADAKPVNGNEYRGQSDCVIVGRYMIINNGDIAIYTVLADKKTGTTPKSNDIDSIKANYTYNVTPDVDNEVMEWDTQLAWPTGSGSLPTPRTIGILFVRSPETGTVYTFTSNRPPTGDLPITTQVFTDMMVSNEVIPGRGEQTLCVKSGGAVVDDRAVYIAPKAASSGAIETRTNSLTTSLGGHTQC